MQPESMRPEPVPLDDAIAIAARHFGLAVTAEALPGEYDANFKLTSTRAPNQRFVLKIMHSARETAFVDLQCRALIHVEAKRQAGSQLAMQRVRPTSEGAPYGLVTTTKGERRIAWCLEYVAGATLAELRPRSDELLASLGERLGELDSALADFSHPAAIRPGFQWDVMQAEWIANALDGIADPARRALLARVVAHYQQVVPPLTGELPRSVIHGDANDHNVICEVRRAEPARVLAIIDCGDMLHTATVAELAIACAYAILDVEGDPLLAAAHVVRGYQRARPLAEDEVAVLFALLRMRLAISVVCSARRRIERPNDPYATISEAPAWRALERLDAIHPRFADSVLRHACGYEPRGGADAARRWLGCQPVASPVGMSLDLDHIAVLDLSFGSTLLGANPSQLSEPIVSRKIARFIASAGKSIGVGRYDEARPIYTEPMFASGPHPTAERRTVHLGIDLFTPVGTPVFAALSGVVHAVARNAGAQDYGPVVVLRHAMEVGEACFTLYGHLGVEAKNLRVGQAIACGERIASIGDPSVNGGWPPHLHFQILLDALDHATDFPGVATPALREVYRSLCPDPNLVLRIPQDAFPRATPKIEELTARRKERLGGNLSVSYSQPLHIVRGFQQYLYDADGRAYLDVYNNVPLVGHSHPHVVHAAQEQLALLNTNTRYLHENAIAYAERLTARMPPALSVCYFVNSASEANELALRLARTHTRRHDVIVLEHAYHGHTTSLIDISPYKVDGPGGRGQPDWVHVAPLPDDYRGRYRRGESDLGARYAAHVGELAASAAKTPRGLAAFIAETLPSVGGQIVLPDGYLAAAYAHVRAQGGVCIADEVQVGFGRLGDAFFGFDTQVVVPDIVVLGKPIGNAFPLAAVVTTREIAQSFDNGMEFFSTFGGNPVACAVGLAVLDVLERENLQENARVVGGELLRRLRELSARHALIGDVRGRGLFLGVELVRERSTREPADREASYLVNRLRERGILAGTDGPHHNVLKIRPPLIFAHGDVEFFVTTLDELLGETPLRTFE